jgi:hypothetical protein
MAIAPTDEFGNVIPPADKPFVPNTAFSSDAVLAEQLSLVLALSKTDPDLEAAWQAYLKGDINTFKAKVLGSKFYQNNNAIARTRAAAEKAQPGVWTQQLDAFKIAARKRTVTAGAKMDITKFNAIVEDAFRKGLNEDQLDALLVSSGNITGYGGDVLGDTTALKTYANSFGVTTYLNKDYWNQKSKDLFSGTVTTDDIKAEIRMKSASAFPGFADQINNGVTLDAISSAYKGAMSSILEIDADSITYSDPRLRRALQSVGPDGKPITKPLWQFERELRSTKEWEYTNNARDTMDSMSMKVLRDMGLA